MSSSKLDEYVALYDQKFALARETAAAQLTTLKEETEAKLSDLYGGVDIDMDEFTKAFDGTFASIDEYVTKGSNVGTAVMQGMLKGVQDRTQELVTGVKSTINEASNAGERKARDGGEDIGYDLVRGFANGIDENTFRAEARAKAMAEAALRAARKALKVKSPSRAFYEVGDYAGQGFVNALVDYATKTYKAGTEMANAAKTGLSDAIGRITDAVNGNIDTQPTIRPVLDLTNIQNGADALNGLFTEQSLALAGVNAGFGSGASIGDLIETIKNSDSGNDDIITAIAELRSDFGSLVTAIRGMHIRMDSGAVVGELIGKIDNGLGQIASHKGRGN